MPGVKAFNAAQLTVPHPTPCNLDGMGAPLLLRAVRYLPLTCLALCAMSLPAQSGTYASSAEYQGMLEELHAPAPSPIFLATGTRPLPEQDLK